MRKKTDMRAVITTLITIGAAAALFCVLGPAAKAQDKGLIAFCPAVYDKGDGIPESRAEAMRFTRLTLEKAGYTVADYDAMKAKWTDLGIALPVEGQPPAPSDLARFGKAVGAKYVLEPEFDFSANRNWNVDKYTTVKAAMNIFKASDGARVYKQTETISKSPKSSDDFRALSQAGREQRVVDQAIDVSLARFGRRAIR